MLVLLQLLHNLLTNMAEWTYCRAKELLAPTFKYALVNRRHPAKKPWVCSKFAKWLYFMISESSAVSGSKETQIRILSLFFFFERVSSSLTVHCLDFPEFYFCKSSQVWIRSGVGVGVSCIWVTGQPAMAWKSRTGLSSCASLTISL